MIDKVLDGIVIGGGPAGSSTARELSSKGYSVMMLERKEEIGIPVQCGECISEQTLEYSGVGMNSDTVCNRVSGYRIISPSGDSIFSSTRGFNIYRDRFDRELSELAVSEGSRLLTGCHVRNISGKEGLFRITTASKSLRSRSLVIACGASIPSFEILSAGNMGISMKALGAKIDIRDDSDEIRFYVKGKLDGGYGYYFPRGDDVNIGLVAFDDVANEFRLLMKRLDIEPNKIKSYHGGAIPISGMGRVVPMNGCILVGDAGGFSNPISKGGIIGAILSGREGARALSRRLSGEKNALVDWDKKMLQHPAFAPINLERNALLGSLDDDALDQLTSITNGRDLWTIRKTELIREAWKRPHLLKLAKESLKLIRGFREWARWAF